MFRGEKPNKLASEAESDIRCIESRDFKSEENNMRIIVIRRWKRIILSEG